MKRTIACLAMGLGLVGCQTHLSVSPVSSLTPQRFALQNPTYTLPMVQHTLAVTYTLSACPGSEIQADGLPKPTALEIEVEVDTTTAYVGGEQFAVDYTTLGSPFKTTDFAIENWPNGGLKSINASVEDHTGEFVAGAVRLGISLASLAAGNPAGAVAAIPDDTGGGGPAVTPSAADQATLASLVTPMLSPGCRAATVTALADKKAALERVKALTREAKAQEQAVADILARAQVRLATRADRRTLARLQGEIRTTGQDLATQQAIVAKADKTLVKTATYVWPIDPFSETGELPATREVQAWLATILQANEALVVNDARLTASGPVSATVAERLAAVRKTGEGALVCGPKTQDLSDPTQSAAAARTIAGCVAPSLTIHSALVRQTAQVVDPIAGTQAINAHDGTADRGLFFRDPMMARLILCRAAPVCGEASPPGAWVEPLYAGAPQSTPQLGQLRFLPFENGRFENNGFSVALAEDGRFMRFQYASKRAIAAALVETGSEVADQLTEYRDQRDEARRQADAAAQAAVVARRADTLAEYTYQDQLLTAELNYAQRRAPASPIVPVSLTNEITRLEGDIAYLQVQRRYVEAVAALNAPVP